MKKLKVTYWLLGFGCGIVLSGILGTICSLNIVPDKNNSDNNSPKTVIEETDKKQTEEIDKKQVEEIDEQQIQQTDASSIGEYKTEKYEEETIEVYIPSNSRAIDIAQILEASGIIADSKTFISFIEEKNKTTQLKHGDFVFSKNLSYEELLENLTYN